MLNNSHVVSVRLFRPHFHDVGVLILVSVNTCDTGVVPVTSPEGVNEATGVIPHAPVDTVTFTHVEL